ncbi:hypothetical protein Csa_014560 [Cucumis sativus]|uniref:Uncharacterized protein n=1 Tax=Cucumis sativus TaxID=3659 RepID=A0A0A0KY76_CUCSA|nr:hypothetical protein Csa_014560 [Cucumis sativus]
MVATVNQLSSTVSTMNRLLPIIVPDLVTPISPLDVPNSPLGNLATCPLASKMQH